MQQAWRSKSSDNQQRQLFLKSTRDDSWDNIGNRTRFRWLSHGLATKEGPKFECAVLPYVRLMFPSAVQSQARGSSEVVSSGILHPFSVHF
jgi:hypothetical protein